MAGRTLPSILRSAAVLAVFSFLASPLSAQGRCIEPSIERITYDWHLAGALSWIAAIAFPTSGTAELETSWNRPETRVDSRLMIRDKARTGYFLYRSTIEAPRQRTLESEHGYSWDGRTKIEKAVFDYGRKTMRISEEDTRDGPSAGIEAIPGTDLRDVLTGIWMLRQRAGNLDGTQRVDIFSDGKLYPVQFVPLGVTNLTINRAAHRARGFRIEAAPEQRRKWPGGVNVWLSDNEARIPLRIEIRRSVATLRLTMRGTPMCGDRQVSTSQVR